MPTPKVNLPLLNALADGQAGHFSTAQATAIGVGRDALSRLARAGGPLERVDVGVYAMRDREASYRGRAWAGMLVAGPQAVAARRTVQNLRQMDGAMAYEPIDIYHPNPRRKSELFVRSRSLVLPNRIQVVHGIRCSDDETTLAQLGAVIDVQRLERAVEWYLRTHGPGAYDRLTSRLGVKGSTGLLALREVLEKRPPDLPATHSELETRFWQLVRDSERITQKPERQVPIIDPDTGRVLFYLDNGWMDLLLYAELDGVAAHTSERAIFHDRHRMNRLTSMLGLRPLHFTWNDVVKNPGYVIYEVARAIETARRTVLRAG